MRIVQRRFAVVLRLMCCCLLVSGLSGCGGATAGPARSTVAGMVKFKGEPVAHGQIRFTPDKGPFAQAEIRNGKYQVDYKGGVPARLARIKHIVLLGLVSGSPYSSCSGASCRECYL